MDKPTIGKITAAAIIITAVSVVACIIICLTNVGKNDVEPEKKPIRIGLSMDTLKEDRWRTDRDLITKRAEDLGASVTTLIANGDDDLQKEQIENFILQKMDIIIIVPHNGDALVDLIKRAHDAEIKVIAYDRLIKSPYVDLYISFDNEKTGRLQAQGIIDVTPKGNFAYLGGSPTDNNSKYLRFGTMNVLDPYIKSGAIRVVLDKDTANWDPEEAYKNLKEFLGNGGTVNAVIAANDGVAFGAIRALKEFGLSGRIPVSGQDAELTACQRIVEGTQTMTVLKPIDSLASETIDIALMIAEARSIKTNSNIEGVPSLLLEPILVNKSNIDSTVIADGFHSRKEIYGTE